MPHYGVIPSRRTRARRPALLSRRSGVTILEVLAAAAILGIGLVGVGSMVTYAVVSHRKAVNYTIASERATRELERVREAGYLGADVSAGLFPSPTYTILSSTQVEFTVPELTDGQGAITLDEDTEAQAVDPNTGLPYANMKQVQVDISWGGSRSLRGSYSVATLVSNRP